MDQETFALMALWRVPGLSAHRIARIHRALGSYAAAAADPLACEKIIGMRRSIHIPWHGVESDLKWYEKTPNSGWVTLLDPHYPASLRAVESPPPVLYYLGHAELLHAHSIAVVGSRKPTIYGRQMAECLTHQLASSALTIVSGLALGIDAIAHQTALKKGKTIGVMATGLDHIYPASHQSLAQKILKEGLLVSEFPLGIELKKYHFLQRNRTLSGLSLGTLVVEAGIKSGSLMTAQYAAEQGREVFAVPGLISNANAHGCHQLIQQGAKLVQHVYDILSELPELSYACASNASIAKQTASSDEWVLQLIEQGAVTLNDLLEKTSYSSGVLSAILFRLELNRYIQQGPWGYELIRN